MVFALDCIPIVNITKPLLEEGNQNRKFSLDCNLLNISSSDYRVNKLVHF